MIRYPLIAVMILLSLIGSLVSGCSGVGSIPTPVPTIMLPTPGDLLLLGSCEDRSQLETWLQGVMLREQEFWGYVATMEGKSQADLQGDVSRMGVLIAQIGEMPVPDCGAEVHRRVIDTLLEVAIDLQAYINAGDDSGDLPAIMAQAEMLKATLELEIAPFQERLQQQYEN